MRLKTEASKLWEGVNHGMAPVMNVVKDQGGHQVGDHNAESGQNRAAAHENTKPTPAGCTHKNYNVNTEREIGTCAEGGKKNMASPC